MTNKRTNNSKNKRNDKGEMRGFFAALRMTRVSWLGGVRSGGRKPGLMARA